MGFWGLDPKCDDCDEWVDMNHVHATRVLCDRCAKHYCEACDYAGEKRNQTDEVCPECELYYALEEAT